MDDVQQARAYAEADFDESNSLFVDLFAQHSGDWNTTGTILDLGCGPGDIAIRLAQAWPDCKVHGLDGSEAMLAFAEQAKQAAPDAADRVQFICDLVPVASLPCDSYQAVISNSLLHHLHDPSVLWSTIKRFAAPGSPVLVMDLLRTQTLAEAQALVDRYAGDDPAVLKTDFYNSLLAAFEPDEVRDQLASAGLGNFTVEQVSDRHLAVSGHMPDA